MMMAVIMQQTTLIMETVVDLMLTHNIAQNVNVFLEAVEVLLQVKDSCLNYLFEFMFLWMPM